jgi:hypothetical protein
MTRGIPSLCLALAAWAAATAPSRAAPSGTFHAEIRAACDALLAAPDQAETLDAFAAKARELPGGLAFRTELAGVYGLGLLTIGQTDKARAVVSSLMTHSPSNAVLQWFKPSALNGPCPACEGRVEKPCDRCEGGAKCARCGGKGSIAGSVIGDRQTRPACPTCRGTGNCPYCLGLGKSRCAACGGRGYGPAPDRIREQYLARLRDARQYAYVHEHPDMLAIADAMAEARHSMDLPSAVSGLRAAIQRYADAENAGEARALLASLEKDAAAAAWNQKERRRLVEKTETGGGAARAHASQIASTLDKAFRGYASGGGRTAWRDGKAQTLPFVPTRWDVSNTSLLGSLARTTLRVEGPAAGGGASTSATWTVFLELDGKDWSIFGVEP